MKVFMFGGLVVSALLSVPAFAQDGSTVVYPSYSTDAQPQMKKHTRINRNAARPQTFDNYNDYYNDYRGYYGAYAGSSGQYTQYPDNSYPVYRGRPSVEQDPLQPQPSYKVDNSDAQSKIIAEKAAKSDKGPAIQFNQKWQQGGDMPVDPYGDSVQPITPPPPVAESPTILFNQKWEQVGQPSEPLPKDISPYGQPFPIGPTGPNGDTPEKKDDSLSRKEALALYSDFHADQIPSHTQFSFSNIAIPEGSRCANSRGVIVGKAAVTCTPCLDGKAILDGQAAPQLGSYELQSSTRNASNTVVYTFAGKNGEIKMTCSSADPDASLANASLPDMVKGLERAGIALKFKKPQTAQLMLPVENASQAPGAAK